jgi:hypothetical protein
MTKKKQAVKSENKLLFETFLDDINKNFRVQDLYLQVSGVRRRMTEVREKMTEFGVRKAGWGNRKSEFASRKP